jgi:hypothetical protein
VERVRGEHRSRSTPHQLLRLVGDVQANELEEPVGAVGGRCNATGDEQDPRLTAEERRVRRRGKLDVCHKARFGAVQLERPVESGRQFGARLRVTVAPEGVQRPDDPGGPGVDVLERHSLLPGVPLVRRPEAVGVVRVVRVRDDRADCRTDKLLVPRLVGKRLEPVRRVQH